MPRESCRQHAIKSARKLFKRLLIAHVVMEDDVVDVVVDGMMTSMEPSSLLQDFVIMAYARLNALQSSRYSQCQIYRASTYAVPRFVAKRC